MTVGSHIIADFYGVDSSILSTVDSMADIFEETVRYSGATKLASNYYQFEPFGASGVILLAESHMSFHTWPEHELVTLDIYTCGSPEMTEKAYEYLLNSLKPKKVDVHRLTRGLSVPEHVYSKPIIDSMEGSKIKGVLSL